MIGWNDNETNSKEFWDSEIRAVNQSGFYFIVPGSQINFIAVRQYRTIRNPTATPAKWASMPVACF